MDHRYALIRRVGVLILLLLFFVQTTHTAVATSITLDEPLHIASGYACLLTGDYRLVEEHPPFLKMLQAAPLLLADPPLKDPRSAPGWAEGNLVSVAQAIVVAYRPIDPLVVAARVPTMLVGVLLGALIYRWARELACGVHVGGPRATRLLWPFLALFLYAFDPNMVAHASVAATDLGAAAAIFAAAYTFLRWLKDRTGPRWSRALIAAGMLGIALGTKNTALLLGPVFALLLFFGRPRERHLRPYLIQGAAIAVGAFALLWSFYRFEVGTYGSFPLPVPAPSHLGTLARLQQHMRNGHSAFLLGQTYHHGDWRYFPVALALKTPLLTLALAGWGSVRWLLRRRKHLTVNHGQSPGLALALFPILYFATSLVSGINIGYRHLLPVLPFLFLLAGSAASDMLGFAAPGVKGPIGHKRLGLRAVRLGIGLGLAATLVATATTTVRLGPWYLAFFNVLAGGPDGGYRYLVDSNLDWGQTWKALRDYLDARGVSNFYMSNYTINDPHAYGLNYTPLPPWPDAPPVMPQRFDPPPGVYAISTTQLQGVVVADPEMFDYFRRLEPTARIGHAMFVYDVPEHAPVDWVAQCTVPVSPLSVDGLREGLGLAHDVPILGFDCEQSWILPPGEGRYVTSLSQVASSWPPVSPLRLAYEQQHTGFAPPFDVYEWADGSPEPTPPARVGASATVGGVLTFLGNSAPSLVPGQTGEVETWWRILARPDHPVSLMAHLVASDGSVVAVGDGLGVPTDEWLPGSLLIQRHRMAIPEGTEPGVVELQVGAYTYPELERLDVVGADGAVADAIDAGPLEVAP